MRQHPNVGSSSSSSRVRADDQRFVIVAIGQLVSQSVCHTVCGPFSGSALQAKSQQPTATVDNRARVWLSNADDLMLAHISYV